MSQHPFKRPKTPTKSTFHSRSYTAMSPAKTANKKSVREPQNNVRMALEMVESLRKQGQQYRSKLESVSQLTQQQKQQIFQLKSENTTLLKDNQTLLKKYKKMKLKYHTQNEKPPEPETPAKALVQLSQPKQEPKNSKFVQLQQQNRVLREELNNKNMMINKLCVQVHECEDNTISILKIINVLEQKVQELTMDNSLLKGLIHERNSSRLQTEQNFHNKQF